MNKEELLKEGFIPLIEWEEKYKDRLLISFPSFTYRKDNIIAKRCSETQYNFYEISKVTIDPLVGYRVPDLTPVDYKPSKS